MRVSEIFTGIQGESSHQGLPCTFIRLSGCNLACSYCDTLYASAEGAEYAEHTIGEVMKEVRSRAFGIVELTGGEPLLQPQSTELAANLLGEGYTVLVETNGSLGIGGLDPRAVVIMDVKTPGSGMAGSTDMNNLGCLRPHHEVKFVIADRADYDWSMGVIREHGLIGRCGVLLSPAFGVLRPELLIGWMIEERVRARLNLQLHKYIFGPDRRGV